MILFFLTSNVCAILWTEQNPNEHKLLKNLGPEPLSKAFNGDYLFTKTEHRHIPIKTLLMDSHVVVGIGNIYVCETLFSAGISPLTPCNHLNREDCDAIVTASKLILKKAIKAGGTSLKDFISADGKPGYFQLELAVYGREKQACLYCQHLITKTVINGRSSFYCPHCQT